MDSGTGGLEVQTWVGRSEDFVLQIGEEEGEVEEEHPVETFTNQAFKNDDEE